MSSVSPFVVECRACWAKRAPVVWQMSATLPCFKAHRLKGEDSSAGPRGHAAGVTTENALASVFTESFVP